MSLLDELTPDERAAADAAVARLRAERDVAEADARGRDLAVGGLSIDRPGEVNAQSLAYAPPAGPSRVEQLAAEHEAAESEDFNAFWSARRRQGKVLRNVHGIDLQLPAELPLRFEVEARRLQNDRSVAAIHHLFGLLYGEGALARLVDAGLTAEQLSVLLMWGTANGNGRSLTLAEAEAAFEDAKAKQAAGKAVVPSGTGGTSSDSGRSSNATSPGSTKRGKKKSRR